MSPTRFPTSTRARLIRPSIGRIHPAIAQVDLGAPDRGPGRVHLRLGGEDVRLVVGLRLLDAGAVGLDLRLALLAIRLGPVELLARAGLALHEVAGPRLLDPGQHQERLVERQLRLGDLAGLGLLGLLQGRLRLGQVRLGQLELDPERLLVDGQEELALLDVGALLEVPLLEEPLDPRPDVDRLDRLRRPRVLEVAGHRPTLGRGDRHLGRRGRDVRVLVPAAGDQGGEHHARREEDRPRLASRTTRTRRGSSESRDGRGPSGSVAKVRELMTSLKAPDRSSGPGKQTLDRRNGIGPRPEDTYGQGRSIIARRQVGAREEGSRSRRRPVHEYPSAAVDWCRGDPGSLGGRAMPFLERQ